jgi:site-specific DNA recombinase
MRTYFAYIRVSTVKQGEKGSSLSEQKDAILRYAAKNSLEVGEWFEEQVTAAKRGRAEFRRMLNRLKKGNAHGLIMHKVDRGARNLADWAELAALMDIGVDVHFAHEAMDMQSRGGRLSADIQAVVAADYIRNLRDEVKKGQRGRLKNGMYPFGAMPGYVSQGSGKPKIPDPVQGPLIREAFEGYATGRYTLRTLSIHMKERGLRNSVGNPLGITCLSKMLSTPFYCGLIRVKGQTYIGAHEPLISKMLFDHVRTRAGDRIYPRTRKVNGRDYAFRRMIKCAACAHSLYAEVQKTRIYYRCHTKKCQGTTISERDMMDMVALELGFIHDSPSLQKSLTQQLEKSQTKQAQIRQSERQSLELILGKQETSLRRLTDLFIEGSLDRDVYESRKTDLHNERLRLQSQIKNLSDDSQSSAIRSQYLELLNRLRNIAQIENPTEKREMLGIAISNLSISQKTVDIQWSNPIRMLIDMGGSLAVRSIGTNLDDGCDTSQSVTNHVILQYMKDYKDIDAVDNIIRVFNPDLTKEDRAARRNEVEAKLDELYLAIISDEKLAAWKPFGKSENNETDCEKGYPNLKNQKVRAL